MKKMYNELYERKDNEGQALERLSEIVKVLRVECPWDKVQTHKTLTKCMLEEAYEVVEAINNEDSSNLREELGDVLLQVVFHSNLSENENQFSLAQVINEECDKMIRRHPLIFSQDLEDESIKTIDKTLEKWENIKSKEHGSSTYSQRLENVPKAFPALLRGQKVQSKAAQAGFDWEDVSGAFQKIEEEYEELRVSVDKGDVKNMEEELGDLLFSVVNAARFLDINAEEACNKTTDKFISRFKFMEKTAIEQGLDLGNMTLVEMDNLWDQAKKFY